jgi:sugar lactone lactonase YvrE
LTVVVAPTPLRGANGLACFDRRLFVAEALADRVAEVSPTGVVQPLSVPSGLGGPDDLLFDPDGNLYVTAAAAGEVWRRDRRGSWTVVARELPGVNGIARDPGGRIFVGACFLGDGVFEIDPAGASPPRVIARDLGCPNAMVADGPGSLVVPLLAAGKVVRLRADGGTIEVLVSGLGRPVAAKRAPDGSIVVLDAATGAIRSLGVAPSAHAGGDVVARLAPGLDGFTTCGESALVSNFLSGEVRAFKPWPTSSRILVPPGLAAPHGMAQSGDTVLVSDGVSIKRLRDGDLEVVAATAIDAIPPPYGLALAPGGFAWITVPHLGEVHRLDLAARTSSKIAGGFDWPTAIVTAPSGGVVVADSGAGRVVHVDVDGSTRPLASGLLSPIGLAWRGRELLTIEPEGGRVLALREGSSPAVVASGLASPAGLAADAAGHLFVVERRTQNLVRIAPDGAHVRVAQSLPIDVERPRPEAVPVLAEADGAILIAGSDGSVLRVTP